MAVAVLGDEMALDEPVRPRAVEAGHRDTNLQGTMTAWHADSSCGYLHRVCSLLRLMLSIGDAVVGKCPGGTSS